MPLTEWTRDNLLREIRNKLLAYKILPPLDWELVAEVVIEAIPDDFFEWGDPVKHHDLVAEMEEIVAEMEEIKSAMRDIIVLAEIWT